MWFVHARPPQHQMSKEAIFCRAMEQDLAPGKSNSDSCMAMSLQAM